VHGVRVRGVRVREVRVRGVRFRAVLDEPDLHALRRLFYSYFLKDGCRILNSVFLLEAMDKYNNEAEPQLK
jgi:hypothetical protein